MRISGSPPLRSSDASACSSVPSLRESTSLPVTSSPHAAALTNSDGLRPTCGAPVALRELVADQPVARCRIRDAQQRLGEAHERDAFARIERELEHQGIHAARLVPRGANAFGKPGRKSLDLRQQPGRRGCFVQERDERGRFLAPVVLFY